MLGHGIDGLQQRHPNVASSAHSEETARLGNQSPRMRGARGCASGRRLRRHGTGRRVLVEKRRGGPYVLETGGGA